MVHFYQLIKNRAMKTTFEVVLEFVPKARKFNSDPNELTDTLEAGGFRYL